MLAFLGTNYEGDNKPFALSPAEDILEAECYFSGYWDTVINKNGLPRKILVNSNFH